MLKHGLLLALAFSCFFASATIVQPATAQPEKPTRFFIELKDSHEPVNSQGKQTPFSKLATITEKQALIAGRNKQQSQFIAKISQLLPKVKVVAQLNLSRNAIVANLDDDQLSQISALPQVARVSPSRDFKLSISEAVKQIGADKVWDLNGTDSVLGSGITVAVIDSGIDYTHPDLGGCFGTQCKVAGGFDFLNDDADPMDDNNHGTHVAGIIAANGELRGVAPAAKLLAYKVCTRSGACPDYAVINGIEAAMDPDGDPATDDAADIINLSLGGSVGKPDDMVSQVVDEAVDAGIVVVVAAGNYNESNVNIGTPGNAVKALTVAASSGLDHISHTSSPGYIEQNGHVKPELAAPGVNINSTIIGGGYAQFSGTSMATPMVAGAAALLLSAKPHYDVDQVKAALIGTTTDLGLPFYSQGSGVVNVLKAMQSDIAVSPGIINLGWHSALEQQRQTRRLTVHNDRQISQQIELSVSQQANNPINYALSTNSLTLGAGEDAQIDLEMTIPADLPPLMAEDPAYIAMLNIGTQSIPVSLLHTQTITVNFEGFTGPDFDWYATTFFLIEKTRGLQRWKSGSGSQTQLKFLVDEGEYAIAMQYAYRGIYYMAYRLDVGPGQTVDFSLQDDWHQLKLDVTQDDGTRLDENGSVAFGYSLAVAAVVPEYNYAMTTINRRRFQSDPTPTLYVQKPTSKIYYDVRLDKATGHKATDSLWLKQRLDLNSPTDNRQLTFNSDVSRHKKLNFTYAPIDNLTNNGIIDFEYVRSYNSTGIAIGSGEASSFTTTPIVRRELIGPANISPAADFHFKYKFHTYIVNDDNTPWKDSIKYQTAQYDINHKGELLLSNNDSRQPQLKTININKSYFDFKAGYLLPAFKAKMVNRDGQFSLSYDQAKSTGWFSDNLLTHYIGLVQYNTTVNDTAVDSSYPNKLINDNDRPADIDVDSNSKTIRFSFDKYQIDGTPVELVAELDFDLTKTDFSPPVISELWVKTLGSGHTHLANGNGEISVLFDDETSLANNVIRIRASGSQQWTDLASTTELANKVTLTDLAYGSYDLQVVAQDQSGNKITYTASPAFISESGCRYDSDCNGRWDQLEGLDSNPNSNNDSDNDGYPDAIDSFPYDSNEWLDTDGDNIGNNADSDDDNDGMSDSFELKYGFDPLDANDAKLDNDKDGFSNLEEMRQNTDPTDHGSLPVKFNGWLQMLMERSKNG